MSARVGGQSYITGTGSASSPCEAGFEAGFEARVGRTPDRRWLETCAFRSGRPSVPVGEEPQIIEAASGRYVSPINGAALVVAGWAPR